MPQESHKKLSSYLKNHQGGVSERFAFLFNSNICCVQFHVCFHGGVNLTINETLIRLYTAVNPLLATFRF